MVGQNANNTSLDSEHTKKATVGDRDPQNITIKGQDAMNSDLPGGETP